MCYVTVREQTVRIRTPRLTVRPMLRNDGVNSQQHPHPVKKLETKGAEVVASGCDSYPTKTEAVRKPAKKRKAKNVKAGK